MDVSGFLLETKINSEYEDMLLLNGFLAVKTRRYFTHDDL